MSSYGIFAQYYDRLTENISYTNRAAFFSKLIQQYGNGEKNILDLACGTGSLTFALSDLDYQVMGVDGSEKMLTQAMMKNEKGLLFLHQKMESLRLYEPTDAIICALDSLNHVTNPKKVQMIFEKVADALVDGGLFIFDVNSRYKQNEILANETFLYDLEEIYCVWQNSWIPEKSLTEIDLDFFIKQDKNRYVRYEEHFAERVYDDDEIKLFLKQAGLQLITVLADDEMESPTKTSQRLIYVAKKATDTEMEK